MKEKFCSKRQIHIKPFLMVSVKQMSVIRLKINETYINKYTDEKNSNHLQVRLLTRTETISRIFLTSQKTSTLN